ncbi:MAG: ATP-binding cassette domain-containing protein [Sulfurimonadaceae bacterium]
MIQFSNVSKAYGSQELFSNITFKLNPGNKMGLVGRNGSGKSTMFKLILGEEEPTEGNVVIPKNYKIGALRQHLTFTEKTLREEAALALEDDMKWDTYRVEKILFGLGFEQADLDKSPLDFSGGYQIRINLAKLLVTEPNLLLLDEPTNYLDILSLRWLKSFLRAFQGEVVLVTHDRDFMDGICTHTMGIIRRDLFMIPGDTHKFYAQLAENEELYAKQKVSQDKKVKELEEFIARNKARASTAALAQSKVKQLEKMDLMEDIGFDSTLKFDFQFKDTPANVLLDVQDISFGYTPDNVLFKNISFTIEKGHCLAIIGKNGVGKSTLLNNLAKELTPLSGKVQYHGTTVTGHFGQTNISRLDPKSNVMDEIYAANPKLSAASVRSICGAMMFSGDNAEKKVSLLSGGEKSRVMLGQILSRPSNLLFLDEPTHHLDIDSIEALTVAIKNFQGSSIIVSHSEELLRRVADRLIIFSKDGAELFDGGYDMFLEKKGWDEDEVEETTPKKQKSSNPMSKENKKLKNVITKERSRATSPLRKEIEKAEKFIMESETQIAKYHQELVEASNTNDNAKVMELSQLVSKLETEVEEKFERMESAQTELDALMAEYEEKLVALEG